MTQERRYYHGVGKRKTAIAQVRLFAQPGAILINGKPLEEAFPWISWQQMVRQPLEVTDTLAKYSIQAKVAGGGVAGQAWAVRHGIARALVVMDETLKKQLKRHGLMTRDARIKESKKYGLKRARKAPQYSKR
jgi:small subunit ribosomal protein S9